MTPQLRGSHLHQLKAKALEIFGSISQTFSMNIKSIGKSAVPTEVAPKAILQHFIVLFLVWDLGTCLCRCVCMYLCLLWFVSAMIAQSRGAGRPKAMVWRGGRGEMPGFQFVRSPFNKLWFWDPFQQIVTPIRAQREMHPPVTYCFNLSGIDMAQIYADFAVISNQFQPQDLPFKNFH